MPAAPSARLHRVQAAVDTLSAAGSSPAHAPETNGTPQRASVQPNSTAPTFQDAVAKLEEYWSKQGCIVWLPHNTEVGAGTMNPATFLRVLGPEPWNVAYVEPSIRPDDSRYGDNPNRLQRHTQFQVGCRARVLGRQARSSCAHKSAIVQAQLQPCNPRVHTGASSALCIAPPALIARITAVHHLRSLQLHIASAQQSPRAPSRLSLQQRSRPGHTTPVSTQDAAKTLRI